MGSIDDIMQLCRLCLVKDQVNIPIFDETSDIRQTFLKINQCLPVKVSRDDNLPKKICDGCSYKLDMLYVFRNTSVDSEKQLVSWLSQLGSACSLPQTIVKDGTTKPEIMVKQETFETTEARLDGDNNELVDAHQELGVDAHSYIIQQQKLPYQQDFAAFGEPSGSTVSEEPPPKKAKRAATVKKHVPLETEEDALETAMQITKAEQEEDSDDVDQPDYVDAPSTSADDQPGPSGVGKGTIEAPSLKSENVEKSGMRTCGKCKMQFENRQKYKNHLRVHMVKNIPCLQCNKKFKTRTELRVHSMRHMEGRPYQCDICEKQFKVESCLVTHKKNHHLSEMVEYTCPICSKKYNYISKYSFVSHVRQHSRERLSCEVCNKTFVQRAYLQRHLLTHETRVKLSCSICDRKFVSRSGFAKHVKVQHEGKKHLCEICGKGLASGSSYQDHMRIHTGEKPFNCTYCEKKFSSKAILEQHIRVHTKEKPYKCKSCDKRYSQSTSLRLHVRAAHSGEKPYICNICSKRFVSRSLLNTHRKCH